MHWRGDSNIDPHAMIERYTIKFGPAVSQMELEKALNESGDTPSQTNIHKMNARIEIIADFEDLKRISELLKVLEKKSRTLYNLR